MGRPARGPRRRPGVPPAGAPGRPNRSAGPGVRLLRRGHARRHGLSASSLDDARRLPGLLRDAIDQYFADRSEYPASLEMLVSEQYLRSVPEDPFTASNTTWQTIMAEFDPSNPLAQGIYDVRSGAEGLAIDGSSYAEW